MAAVPAAWTQVIGGGRPKALEYLAVQQTVAETHAGPARHIVSTHHHDKGLHREKSRRGDGAAERPAARTPVYANNLNGWIKESLKIMRRHDIPGTYDGLYKNIMRESSGNPSATNGWDVNARDGDPSIGLLQVIRPTFLAYHVPGTAESQYNPVANIVAAANYAAARYGSIDNVDSAY
nr:transglycosylase SLT domain-containing protein [Streptomyces sp. NBC_01264]